MATNAAPEAPIFWPHEPTAAEQRAARGPAPPLMSRFLSKGKRRSAKEPADVFEAIGSPKPRNPPYVQPFLDPPHLPGGPSWPGLAQEGQLYYSVWAPYANTEAEGQEQPVTGRHLADSMQLIATYHRKHGRYAEAEGSFRQVLELKRRMCENRPEPPVHSELADTLNDLGLTLLKQGGRKLKEAETVFQEAIKIRVDDSKRTAFQEVYGGPRRPYDPDTAVAFNNLALVHLRQRRFAEAESGFKTALELQQSDGTIYLGAPLELSNITRNLATTHRMMGKEQLAQEGFRLADLCMEAYHRGLRGEQPMHVASDERLAKSDDILV